MKSKKQKLQYIHVPSKDACSRSILSSHRVQGISWNTQATDTAITIPRFLYQCQVYSPSTYRSSENTRSSNAVLQVGLNKRNGTYHDSTGSPSLPPLLTSYFFPSGLGPRREKTACPTPLEGLHRSPSRTVTDAESTLSKRGTPFGSSLRSYTLQVSVFNHRFSLRSRKKSLSVSSTEPGNQAAILLYMVRASKPTNLSLDHSHASIV